MKAFIIGIGGATNGGKTTLSQKLFKQLPNCTLIRQDDYFKPESEVATDERGFKQYDGFFQSPKEYSLPNEWHQYLGESSIEITNGRALNMLESLDMDSMMISVNSWSMHHKEVEISTMQLKEMQSTWKEEAHFLIIDGFLLYNYEPLDKLFNRRYFMTVPYDECKRRRSTRVYEPPDPPGFFDGHVWPMYLKHKEQMEEVQSDIVYLDGTKPEDDIFNVVYADVSKLRRLTKSPWLKHTTKNLLSLCS